MTFCYISPQLLLKKLLFLIFPPLRLLYPLVMVVYSNAQHLFGSFLAYNEVIEMLLEHLGRQSWGPQY